MVAKKGQIPYPIDESGQNLTRPKPKELFWRYKQTALWRLTQSADIAEQLKSLNRLDSIALDEIVVLTRQHNSMRFLRSFLKHYRQLGADRIVVVDDCSTDGSREFLESQKDVVVLPAMTNYIEAQRGRNWLNTALLRLPKKQRIVCVDIDEYLVFSDGQRRLHDLFAAMTKHKLKKLCAVMLDFYPKDPIHKAIFDGQTEQMPWEVASYFDANGYTVQEKPRGLFFSGGVRRRVFGQDPNLTKYPIFFNFGKPLYINSIHAPQPLQNNTFPVGALLLHFKFFSDYEKEYAYIQSRGTHYQGARLYTEILERLNAHKASGTFKFEGSTTTVYENPKQLCDLGLMTDICA